MSYNASDINGHIYIGDQFTVHLNVVPKILMYQLHL